MGTIHDGMARQGLVRPVDGRVLGGVCAGLGQRFGIAPFPRACCSSSSCSSCRAASC